MIPRTLCLMAALASIAGCASNVPQQAVAQPRSTQPVDAARDNRAVTENVVPGLVMRVEVDGSRVAVHDVELMLVPRRPAQRGGGERVVVSGWRGSERVSSVSVSDQRINIEEGTGIVRRDQRSLSVALPTPRRIDRVEVMVPGAAAPYSAPVADVFVRACREQRESELCR